MESKTNKSTVLNIPGALDVPVKDDRHKLLYELLSPVALAEIVAAHMVGDAQYGRNNYLRNGGLEPHRLVSAAQRHIEKWKAGEDLDHTGIHHLAFAASSMMMALHIQRGRSVIAVGPNSLAWPAGWIVGEIEETQTRISEFLTNHKENRS